MSVEMQSGNNGQWDLALPINLILKSSPLLVGSKRAWTPSVVVADMCTPGRDLNSPLARLLRKYVHRLNSHMERVKQLAAHLSPSGLAALDRRAPNDVVITMAIRSPLCKAKKGGFKDARFGYLYSIVSNTD